ncbi:hypothetical protein TNCV_2009551 [Trichonephila clavipes]|nr:hypothetical protein TNCV_2009551 [Trichonephila clavipes]
MRRTAEKVKVPDKFMLELFLQWLPKFVQTFLTSVADLTLDKAAKISNKILEFIPIPMEIHVRHCCRVSAADKVWRDPRPDAVQLYSGCTPSKRRAWFLPDDRHMPPTLDSVVGGGTASATSNSLSTSVQSSLSNKAVSSFAGSMFSPLSAEISSVFETSTSSSTISPTSKASASPSNLDVQTPSASTTTHYSKQNSKTRTRKRKKELLKEQKPGIEIKLTPQMPRKTSYEDEDIIIYEVDEEELLMGSWRDFIAILNHQKDT